MTLTLYEGEKSTPIMIYAPNRMLWGDLVHPAAIRPQIWLKNTIVPEFLNIHNANLLIFGNGEPVRSSFSVIHVPIEQVLAYHILPPAEYIPDYDEAEPNRAMVEVVANADIFRFDGLCRIATIADFKSSILGFREPYRPFYSVSVSHPTAPKMKPLLVPYVLIRSNAVFYMLKS